MGRVRLFMKRYKIKNRQKRFFSLTLLFLALIIGAIGINAINVNKSDNISDLSDLNDDIIPFLIYSSSSDYSDIGTYLNVSEYGQGIFEKNNYNITNNEKASIVLPSNWQAREIVYNITQLYDYDSIWMNQSFDENTSSSWIFSEDDNPTLGDFDWVDASGPDSAIRFKINSTTQYWPSNTNYNLNFTFNLDRDEIPFKNWEFSFRYKYISNRETFFEDIGGASKFSYSVYSNHGDPTDEGMYSENIPKLDYSTDNGQWFTKSVLFTPEVWNLNIPNILNVEFNLYLRTTIECDSGWLMIYVDDVILKIPTIPKPSQLNLTITDETNDKSYSISDIGNELGKGTVNIDDNWDEGTHYFTISSNSTGYNIIYSQMFVDAISSKNTVTELNYDGCEFIAEQGEKNVWTTYFPVSIPGVYENGYYFNVSKPTNWNVTHVYDPYGNDKISSLLATSGIGSDTLVIPNSIVIPGGSPINGRWKIMAESPNYVLDAKAWKYNEPNWNEETSFQESDLVKINATINTTLNPKIAQTNATMLVYHPNGTLWFQLNQILITPASGYFEFPNFTIGGKNTTTGTYSVHIRWNDPDITQVGLFILTFEVFHSSSLEREKNQDAVVEPIFTGDFVPIKVNYTDIDAGIGIYDADVSYIVVNATGSTIASGVFIYYGGGVYLTEISTVGWTNGDYNVSVAANKSYYQSQNRTNLIKLRVTIATSLESSLNSATVPWGTNMTLDVYYNRSDNHQGINTATINTNWNLGYWSVSEIIAGQYRMEFNTSGGYELGDYQIVINATMAGYETKEISFFLTIRQRFTNISFIQPDAVNYRDNLSILVSYGDADNESWIPDGEIVLSDDYGAQYWDPSIYTVHKISPKTYNITFNSTNLGGVGTSYVYITAHKNNYANATTYVNININDIGTILSLFLNGTPYSQGQKKLLEVDEVLNVTVTYQESVAPNNHIENASVELSSRGNFSEDDGKQIYYKLINASSLGQGANIMTVIAQKAGFVSQTIYFLIEITERNTTIELFINNVKITDLSYVEHELTIGQSVNISVFYKDKYGAFIHDPTSLEISGEGIRRDFTEYYSPDSYNVTIDSSELGFATNTFLIYAYKVNYQQQSINIRIKVIDKPTDISVYLNNEIRIENGITLAYGATLNISVIFTYNESGVPTHLSNASVTLTGGGFNDLISENITYKIYTIIITTDQLDLGLCILSIVAEKTNYETSSANLRIVVRTIATNIKTETGAEDILATVGQNIYLRIVINDTDNKLLIKGLDIRYSWAYGTGKMLESDGDGVYEALLSNVPYGLYQISITVFNASDIYNFEPFRITISISYTTEQSSLIAIIQILIVVSILGAIGFSSYIYAYQKVLKYPKPVRKVRKVKKGLKKKKLPDIDVLDRTSTLKNVFESELFTRAKFLKKMTKEDVPEIKGKEISSTHVSMPDKEGEDSPQIKPEEKRVIQKEEKPAKRSEEKEETSWIDPFDTEEKKKKEIPQKPEIKQLPSEKLFEKPKIEKLPSEKPIQEPELEEEITPSKEPIEKSSEDKEDISPEGSKDDVQED